jgi:hypothetical protein
MQDVQVDCVVDLYVRLARPASRGTSAVASRAKAADSLTAPIETPAGGEDLGRKAGSSATLW